MKRNKERQNAAWTDCPDDLPSPPLPFASRTLHGFGIGQGAHPVVGQRMVHSAPFQGAVHAQVPLPVDPSRHCPCP